MSNTWKIMNFLAGTFQAKSEMFGNLPSLLSSGVNLVNIGSIFMFYMEIGAKKILYNIAILIKK